MADNSNIDVPRRSEPGEVSLYAPLRVILENRYLVVVAAVTVALFAAVPPLFGPRTYTANAAFMPQGGSGGNSGLAAFAGQFGINVGQSEPSQSPQFYAEIARSPELIGRLLADTFTVAINPDTGEGRMSGDLIELLGVEGSDPARIEERGRRTVADMITVATTPTGMVRLGVTSTRPELSSAMAASLIERINEFNLETRQSNAAAEGRFIQERLSETQASLRRTEDELRAFLEANRQFQNSPQLVFEYDRLQREVAHQQQLYTGLQESYENARIAQVRDTPLITVVEPPRQPVYPDSRRIPLRFLLGALVGGMVGVLIAFVREFVIKGPARTDPEYALLHDAWRDAVDDLHLLARRAAPGSAAGARSPDASAGTQDGDTLADSR